MRPQRIRALAATAAFAMLSLAGCASTHTSSSDPPLPASWTAFGSFEKPAAFADVPILPGPNSIRLPNGEIAPLDAAKILGSGVKLPARDDYTVTAESYLYTKDLDEPIIVGLVQATHIMRYRGHSEDEYVTFVLGISAETEPRELTRTRLIRGEQHSASFAAQSDEGVVAVLLSGKLNTDSPDDSRVVGVDAVRGTEVWGKEHGFSSYGEGTAQFFVAPTPESCAAAVQTYNVANGIVEKEVQFKNTDPKSGGTCKTANGHTPTAG